MKKVLLFTFVLILSFSLSVYAHPPGEIEMSFNTDNNMLEVTVSHGSNDNTDHFINNVKVYLNDQLHIDQNFIIQTDNEVQYLHYMIPGAKSGDTIRLTADCNKFGSRESELTVE
jgi:desulfoferrodoxin (superoxide reductase-like protein)